MPQSATNASRAACRDAECGLFALARSAEVQTVELKTVPVAPPLDPSADEWEDAPLYEARRKIYPQRVAGTYRRIKWAVLLVTLGIYYLTPFLRWDRGPNAPGQAVLIDLSNSRFYFFFIEIWPQEIYYLTGLLIIAAMTLFLMNALAGRIWCGYLCPQTVWTDLFQAIERLTEGDRREHMRREQAGWTAERIARLSAKHFLWLMVAWWTGGAWVLYFADAPTLVYDLATLARAVRCLSLDRHSHLHDLRSRGLHARAGVPLYVPVAAHPGRAHRRARAQRHLSLRSRRAARLGEEECGAAGKGPARRRLHRLPAMRACLPDRRGHPARAEPRLHPVRAVHRRLRRRDGQDRSPHAAHRLRYRPQYPSSRARTCAGISLRSDAHAALRRDHRSSRRRYDLSRWSHEPRNRSASCTTAIRCS